MATLSTQGQRCKHAMASGGNDIMAIPPVIHFSKRVVDLLAKTKTN